MSRNLHVMTVWHMEQSPELFSTLGIGTDVRLGNAIAGGERPGRQGRNESEEL